MKSILLLLCISITGIAAAQHGFLQLRKGDRTIQTFFEGSYIRFESDNFQWMEGRVKIIRDDSIYIDLMVEKAAINHWGMLVSDTVKYGLYGVALREIIAVPAKQKGLGIIRSGALFKALGAGYIGLNLINSLIQSNNFFSSSNLSGIGIAAGVFLVGELFRIAHPTTLTLGKKYVLRTVVVK